jgi:hypothetical protein
MVDTETDMQCPGKIVEANEDKTMLFRVRTVARFISFPFLAVGLLLAIFCAWSIVSYGDIISSLAAINGSRVIAKTQTRELGEVLAGETLTTKFLLKNISSQPVGVIGAWADCGCITTSELPFVISPQSQVEFDVKVHTDTVMVGEKITRQVLLNLDIDQPAVSLFVKFSVTETKKNIVVK